MKQLFTQIRDALGRGETVVLCTVLASSGSAPRGAGARMAVFCDGHTAGTIGGGAVERIAAEQAMELHSGKQPYMQAFSLAPNQINDIGMICGGSVTVYFQLFTQKELAFVEALLRLLDEDVDSWLFLQLSEHAVLRMGLYDARNSVQFADASCLETLRPMLTAQTAFRQEETTWYVEPISRAGTVYIFGGGHVGKALVPVLTKIGFRVAVFDNRPDFAKPEVYPEAVRVIFGDYEKLSETLTIGPEDYVVIMTPGHQADRAVLLQAMRTDATYVGCIGSRRKIAATNAFLMENGIPEAALARIHAPIGLAIEAQTPDEIAISVAAELILHRARHAKGEI